MVKPKLTKKPSDMKTEEAMVRVFGKKRVEILKRVAKKLDEEKDKRPRKDDEYD